MRNCMSCYRPVGFEYFTLKPTIDSLTEMSHPLFTEQGGYLCMECVKIIRNGGVVDGDGLRVNRRSTPTPCTTQKRSCNRHDDCSKADADCREELSSSVISLPR